MAEPSETEATQPSPVNQVSLPRWAELKRAYVARHGKEHGGKTAGAENAADPDPKAPER